MEELYIPKWIIMVQCLSNDKYMLEISREMNITYSHAVKLIKLLNSKKFVTIRKSGRRKIISLTSKGRELYQLCNGFLNEIK